LCGWTWTTHPARPARAVWRSAACARRVLCDAAGALGISVAAKGIAEPGFDAWLCAIALTLTHPGPARRPIRSGPAPPAADVAPIGMALLHGVHAPARRTRRPLFLISLTAETGTPRATAARRHRALTPIGIRVPAKPGAAPWRRHVALPAHLMPRVRVRVSARLALVCWRLFNHFALHHCARRVRDGGAPRELHADVCAALPLPPCGLRGLGCLRVWVWVARVAGVRGDRWGSER
jgi:hypothetical protein